MEERYPAGLLREALLLLLGATEQVRTINQWTKCAWARTADGTVVDERPELATRWCVAAAVIWTQLSWWPGSRIAFSIDDTTGDVCAVLGPRRVTVALDLLGQGLLRTNRELIEGRWEGAEERGYSRPLPETHPTMSACAIQDLPQIGYPQMRLGLAAAAAAIYEELRRRGPVPRLRPYDDPDCADRCGRRTLVIGHFPAGRC